MISLAVTAGFLAPDHVLPNKVNHIGSRNQHFYANKFVYIFISKEVQSEF